MKWKRKYYLPMGIICLAVIGSIYYVFFGDNKIETNLEKNKFIINQKIRNIELDKFPLRLQLNLVTNVKSIGLVTQWTTELGFDLTHPPYYDLKNLYLVTFDKIAVYDKDNLDIIWLKQMQYDIVSFSLIDGNNIFIVDSDGHTYALNRNNGEIVWKYDFHPPDVNYLSFSLKPLLITNIEDKRLLTSILIVPINNQIIIFDTMLGEQLFTADLEDTVYHISSYDPIDNAIYVGHGEKITKMLLKKT